MTSDNEARLATIREIVRGRLKRPSEINDDTPLVSGGLVDSMSIVDLILELEGAFGVSIPASEVQPDDFDSIRTIADTIARFG